jgi:hypothetical protein
LTADLDPFYLLSIRKSRAFHRERDFVAYLHVARATHDRHGFPTSSDMADDKVVGLRVRIDPGDLSNGNRLGSLFNAAFDLKAGHGKAIGQAVEWQFDGDELAKPVKRDFHLELPQKT